MKQLLVTIIFAVSIGFVLGRADSLTIPFLGFDATANDLKLFVQYSIVVAVTTIVLNIKINARTTMTRFRK